MKANAKYTALEILKEAGIEKPEEKIGKMRVRIAGIAGIVKPDHLIKIQAETKKIDIIVGQEVKAIEIEGDEAEMIVSEAAKIAIEAEGKILNKKAEPIKKIDLK
jgi:hypothetical protein